MSEQCFSMEKVIEVTNISKTFSGRKVLDNVSISVQRGSICGLVGRNGCGKTVLMKCICGFIVPEIGQIKIFGKKVSRKKSDFTIFLDWKEIISALYCYWKRFLQQSFPSLVESQSESLPVNCHFSFF